MALFNLKAPPYRPPKDLTIDWATFNKGLNLLLRENEIDAKEMAQADNIMLKGKGIPTKRWGMDLYYTSGATSQVRGISGFYPSGASGTIELLAMTDDGYLTKKNGTSYTLLTGASYASGYDASMVQLDNRTYIVNGQREMTRYSSPTLVGFPTIATPSSIGLSQLSGTSGTTSKSYRVTAISDIGETLASTSVILTNQPEDLTTGTIRVAWSAVSTASILKGYNIYGRDPGFERFLGYVDAGSTVYLDNGSSTPAEFTFPPTADTTGGPLCKQITKHQDRLIFGGFDSEPSKIVISGRVPYHERFDMSYGGNYLKIEPDSGDNVIQVISFRDRIIVFKERSIWEVTLSQQAIGNFFVTIPTPKMITNSHGCIAPKSVVAVENDVFFLSRKGVYALGYESGYAFDLLRSNEISVKIRPFIQNLTVAQMKQATAIYHDNKYIISFPSLDQTMVFDRERMAWLGPWTFDGNAYEIYYDSNGIERLLMGKDDCSKVMEISDDYVDDDGTIIATNLKTRKEDFKDWTSFKNIKNVFTAFRNITGTLSVDIRLETRSGSVVTSKSFSVNPNVGNSGWGADLWGDTMFGNTEEDGGGADITDTIRWANLNKVGRTLQLLFKTTGKSDNYELLGVRADARPVGAGIRPSRWRV